MSAGIFHSLEIEIADAISGFKWMKNIWSNACDGNN